MVQNVPQDEPTKAPKIGPRYVNIAPERAQHRANMGPRWANNNNNNNNNNNWWVAIGWRDNWLRIMFLRKTGPQK